MEVRPKAEAPPVSTRPPAPVEDFRYSTIRLREVMEQEGMALLPLVDIPLQLLSLTE